MMKLKFKPKVIETTSWGPFLIACGFVPYLQGVMVFGEEVKYYYHLN